VTLSRALVAFVVALGLSPAALVITRRAGLFDVPSERSSHSSPTPRGGGVAPAIAALIALALTPAVGRDARLALMVTGGAFGALGLVEDVVGVPVPLRLFMQVAAAAASLPWLLHDLTGSGSWQALFAVGVVVWLVAFVNGFNFMDGIDGISVAQVALAGSAWYLIGRGEAVPSLTAGGAIVAAAALGFAPYNLVRARLFLGDAGSYFLGAWLAVLAVLGLRAGVAPEAVLSPLVLYAADTGFTLVRRIRRGEVWYAPHRDHVYQRLVRAGWSHIQTVLLVSGAIGACSALGALSLQGSAVVRVAADAGVVSVLVVYLALPSRLTSGVSEAAATS
jgi:UDP-GlcNAc:undecaprenyl-phosphate/decaprenyl-phosphate GlcNAc-1-phosphate transferase